jgi:hypothetical protein
MSDRHHQLDFLEWAANERRAELDRARSQSPTPLSPQVGRLYVGLSVTGVEYCGYSNTEPDPVCGHCLTAISLLPWSCHRPVGK